MKTGIIKKLIGPDKGFTLIELLAVVTIMTTIAVIAVPPYIQWRQSVQYRSTAKAISAMLLDARSRAISNNLQYRVVFQSPAAVTQYQMTQGNRSANSSDWSTVVQAWTYITNGVKVTLQNVTMPVAENCPSGSNCIDFYPNGAADLSASPPADIKVMDSAGVLHFTVEVSNAGRIKVF